MFQALLFLVRFILGSWLNLAEVRILNDANYSAFFNLLGSGCHDCNSMEDILSWQRFLKPRIHFGVSLEDMVGGERPGTMVSSQIFIISLCNLIFHLTVHS